MVNHDASGVVSGWEVLGNPQVLRWTGGGKYNRPRVDCKGLRFERVYHHRRRCRYRLPK